jgi:hypothetical protein
VQQSYPCNLTLRLPFLQQIAPTEIQTKVSICEKAHDGARLIVISRFASVASTMSKMGVGSVFIDFLQRIAIGAGAVLALLIVIDLGMPERSPALSRRITK